MPEKPTAVQVQFVTSEKYIKIYANSVQLTITPWDFTFSFGELKEHGEKPVVENQVGIIMSPQHTKALLGILATHVRDYEKNIGEIKLPAFEESSGTHAAEPEPAKTH